jgi:hypothetical protein
MIPDPDMVRIRESYQIECECIWIRILESRFRNFYVDPRFAVRTPSSGSDWARSSHVCKGYPASRSSVRNRVCYALQPDHAIQVRQVPNPQTPCLPLPSYGKPSPEPARHGRASISVRQIYVKIIVNLTEILNSWLEIESLRNGQIWEFDFILTVLQLELHNQTTGHGM